MFADPYLFLLNKIEDLERRVRRIVVFGTVTDVDHKRGLVRVDDGMGTEGEPNKTDWLPWAEHAGKIKTRTMPSVGQQVTVLSPSGTPETGIVMIGWYNENNKMPKADAGEYVFINGTRYKKVIGNGPEDTGASGDGSDSTCGGQACPSKDESKNSVGTGIERIRIGKLPDDEGSWGDGKTQVKPQGDDKKVMERGLDETSLIHYVTDGTNKSVIVQKAGDVTSTINDESVRRQTKDTIIDKMTDQSVRTQTSSGINDKVGGSEIDIQSGAINVVAEQVFTVGRTNVGVDSKNEAVAVKVLTVEGPAKKAFSKPE